MRQIFFISPTGAAAVKEALEGVAIHQTHGWRPDGEDKQVVGVVELHGHSDGEAVATALEKAGIHVLPNQAHALTCNQPIAPEHHALLKQHGVAATDTTHQAMTVMHKVSGFPPLKVKRF